MKKTFLVLGIACAALMTYGQSSAQNQKKNPRDAASGQASGKSSVVTARETGSGMATGRTAQGSTSNPTPSAYEQGVITAREAGSGMATGRIAAQAPTGTHHDVSAQADVQTARETGSGMATGKTAQPATGPRQDGVIHRDLAAREAVTGTEPHKTTAADDWDEQQKKKNRMSGAQSNPLYQDNGMSGTNPLYQGSQKITKSRSNIQNNRVAAGDVTGDGSADRAVKTRSNIQNNRVAAGDVNGDGVAEGVVKSKSNITNNLADDSARVKSNVKNNLTSDGSASAAVSQSSEPAQMKGDLSRGHQPDRSSDASAGKGANDKKTAPRDAATGQASGKRQHN